MPAFLPTSVLENPRFAIVVRRGSWLWARRDVLRFGPERLQWRLTREEQPVLPRFHTEAVAALSSAPYGTALYSIHRPHQMVLAAATFREGGLSSGETVIEQLALLGVTRADACAPHPLVLRAGDVLLRRLRDRAFRDGRPTGLFLERASGAGHQSLRQLGFINRGYTDGPSWHLPDRHDINHVTSAIKDNIKRLTHDR